MAHRISPMASSIQEPATLFMARRSRELRAQGQDVIDLSLGEPDHAPPSFVIEAAHKALDGPWHKYPPVNGYADVREAICRKFERDNGLRYTPEQVVVSTGAKQSIMNAILALVGPGDEVVIPSPNWVTYYEQVRMAGGTPVPVLSTLEENYRTPVSRIAAAITPRTRLLIFSSPCNPSGSVFTAAELSELAALIAAHPDLYVVSDEIYEHIVFSGRHIAFASLPGMMERTITVNGLSKGFALTGWRIGYLAAPEWIAKACSRVQGQFTSGTNSIAQRVTIACMEADPALLAPMRADFLRRRDLVIAGLAKVPGWRCNLPDGAFYVLPNVTASLGKRSGERHLTTTNDLCMYLLEEAGVSLVDGDAFHASGTLRLSYATSDEKLTKALERIALAIACLY
ncbi:MAG: pyridoxal phosphate-dependent aminotransferase [Flavobacteriales bacterium]|nr:pyridoxal phosphate-dependent aminotransferase [Flavobacteriales bacterium]